MGHRMKECACKSLHYRFGQNWDTCEECGHPPMFHYAHFNRTVLNPIQRCVRLLRRSVVLSFDGVAVGRS